MANLVIDKNRLNFLIGGNRYAPATDSLYREQSVFFVGGALPVYETLETMFDSFCTEATALFFLTFGSGEMFLQGEEMARQIKKNFHVRLMAGLEMSVDVARLERIYAAGVDNLVFPVDVSNEDHTVGLSPLLQAARTIFPRWGTAATLLLGDEAPARTKSRADELLQEGIVPLLQFSAGSASLPEEDMAAVMEHLVSGWERHSVPVQTYLPLINVMTPLVATKQVGFFRGFVDRLRDRQQLAGSDIRRHLRVQQAENSLDSAGL
ncbi:MAG: hypothetical protein HXX17_04460 [Geobacteraceae bacterium]|nr:hypothetical protein [Geobacteraceae bacterium]